MTIQLASPDAVAPSETEEVDPFHAAQQLLEDWETYEAAMLLQDHFGPIHAADLTIRLGLQHETVQWRGGDDWKPTKATPRNHLASVVPGVELQDAWGVLRAAGQAAVTALAMIGQKPGEEGDAAYSRIIKVSARTQSFQIPGSIGVSWKPEAEDTIWRPSIRRARTTGNGA